jgi:hypothetical protein
MSLPSMHVILNVVEDMLHESCKDEAEWTRITMQLYTPDKHDPEAEGWLAEDQLASFTAFMGAV